MLKKRNVTQTMTETIFQTSVSWAAV